MVQPYDYRLNVPSPFEAFTSGIKIGQAGLEAQERRRILEAEEAQRQAKALAAQQAAERQAKVERDLETFFTKPSYDTLSRLAPYIPKDQFQSLQATFEGKTKETQQNELRFGGQVLSALATGKGNVASELLRQRAAAIGEDTPEGKGYLDAATLAEADPETAMMTTAVTLQALPGSKEIIDRAFDVRALPMAERKTELEIKELEQKLKNANAQAASETGQSVQSSKILDDGTAISVMRDGSTVVRKPDGKVATGEDAATAIRAAQDYGSDLQRLREQSRVTGREVTKVGIDQGRAALETIPKVRSNISNLQRAKELVKQGAETGAIAERFPSWRASTIELLNLRNQLGIDVINSATFGALSESELELALQTALPTKMDQKELESWLDRKIVAQEKLANHLEEAALFFLNGGSAADWLEMQRKERQESEGAAPAAPAAPTPVAPLPAATPAPMQFQFKGVKGASQ